MDAQMRAGRQPGVEVVPEFRRLVADVPVALEAARGEHPLLGAGRLLVAADAGDQPVEAVLGERELQSFGLARRRAGGGRQRRVDRFERRAWLDDEVEVPFAGVAVAERIHFRKLLAGVHMHDRKRQMAEEGLAREPDHHVGVLAERPQQGELLHAGEGFAEDEDALGFEFVEPVHGAHSRSEPGASRTFRPLMPADIRIWQDSRDDGSTARASSSRSSSSVVGGCRRSTQGSST